MPQPSDVHVNQFLTDVSVAFAQDPGKFVAETVFPAVPVPKQSDYFATFPLSSFVTNNMRRRGPGSAAAEAQYTVSKDSYFCDVFALAKLIDDQERANQDAPFNADRDATVYLTTQEMIARENEWGSAFFTTSVWTGGVKAAGTAGDLVGGTDFTKWDDAASDPLGDIATQAGNIEAATGFWPTDLTVTRPVWNALKNHPDILARITGGSTIGNPALVTRQLVAGLMEIERINVSAAVQNTAQENLTATIGYILGKHALLTYRPPAAGLLVPSAGYTFVWTGLTGSQDGRRILRYRVDEKHSDKIEIEATWAQKVVSATLGAFFQNAVS